MGVEKIFIGVPTRNHGWVLPAYLDSILNLDYPKVKIFLYFLMNDCEDNTEEILEKFCEDHRREYMAIWIEKKEYGMQRDDRTFNRTALYSHFAKLKNIVRKRFLETGIKYWLHIDDDTILLPNTIQNFLRHDEGYLCGVCDVLAERSHNFTNVMRDINERYYFNDEDFLRAKALGQLIPAFWVGGIACIRRDVAEHCSYQQHCPNRDDNLGFCVDVRNMGLTCWADPRIELNHIMTREALGNGTV